MSERVAAREAERPVLVQVTGNETRHLQWAAYMMAVGGFLTAAAGYATVLIIGGTP